MADSTGKDDKDGSTGPGTSAANENADEAGRERSERGISDFVRRAVAAGIEAAGRSKDDLVRVATSEIRDWLDRLELDTELRKALSNMVLEVKAEVRFRQAEDGTLTPETDIKVRPGPKG
jgi:hypothetical protein